MSQKEYLYLKNILASAHMEGFPVSAQTESDCIRLLNGSICVSDLVAEILSRLR